MLRQFQDEIVRLKKELEGRHKGMGGAPKMQKAIIDGKEVYVPEGAEEKVEIEYVQVEKVGIPFFFPSFPSPLSLSASSSLPLFLLSFTQAPYFPVPLPCHCSTYSFYYLPCRRSWKRSLSKAPASAKKMCGISKNEHRSKMPVLVVVETLGFG
jgi:hypothetical protein